MKILTIQAAYFPMIGGAELFHKVTAECIAAKGHSVDILTCLWDKPDITWENWQNQKETINGTTIYRVRPWFYIQFLKSIGAIWPLYYKALNLIKENNYDAIHTHIFPALIVGALLKRKTGIPLITTVQGGDLADYSETGSSFSLVLKPVISWSLKQADIVHVVSTYLKNSVQALGASHIRVITNGVESELFKPGDKKSLRAKAGINNEAIVIVSNSRLTPKNGLDLLIKAIAQVQKIYPIKLFIIGGGEQEQELKDLVKDLNLNDNVEFLGYLSHDKAAEYLGLSDIFARPSRDEGFGISFLEAMSSGLPAVGTRVGGIPDIITDKQDGFLIEPENVPALREVIEKLCRDKKLREKIGNKGREKVIKHYSWKNICNEVLTMYKQVINQ